MKIKRLWEYKGEFLKGKIFVPRSEGPPLTHQQQTAFENIVGKGEIARNEQFLLFPQCFQLNQITVSPFVHIFAIISVFANELEESKIGM